MKKVFLLCALVTALVMASCSSGSKLEYQISQANKQCPVSAGPGLTLSEMRTESNNVLCICNVEENLAGFSIADINNPDAIAAMKPAIVQAIASGSDGQELVELVKDANYNIVYRLIGSPSNAQLDIVIYSHEL